LRWERHPAAKNVSLPGASNSHAEPAPVNLASRAVRLYANMYSENSVLSGYKNKFKAIILLTRLIYFFMISSLLVNLGYHAE
jgi:hypothetical protein